MRVYAKREDTGRRILVAIACDVCDEEIKPSTGIRDSGWTKQGVYYGPGDYRNIELDLCPAHSSEG